MTEAEKRTRAEAKARVAAVERQMKQQHQRKAMASFVASLASSSDAPLPRGSVESVDAQQIFELPAAAPATESPASAPATQAPAAVAPMRHRSVTELRQAVQKALATETLASVPSVDAQSQLLRCACLKCLITAIKCLITAIKMCMPQLVAAPRVE